MLARCPSCRNTFSTDRPGRQDCPICGKPLVVPEPAAVVPARDAAARAEEPAGTPWERRGELGFWTGWLQTLQQALLEPGKLFASARRDRGAAQLGFAVLTTSAFWAIGQIFERLLLGGQREQMRRLVESMSRNRDLGPMLRRMIEVQTQASSPAWVVALVVLTPLFSLVFLYLNAAVTHGVAALLGQARRGFPATFAACAYACAPLALLAWALGGAIALCGALAFAELGGLYHSSGAQYAILRDSYGPMTAFLFVFCNATAIALAVSIFAASR